jgi:hypothetical protein
MSEGSSKHPEAPGPAPGPVPGPDNDLEDYSGGYIQAHHGSIPLWLMVVYFGLAVWGLYYLYAYWGGLGPGLDYLSQLGS